MSVLAGGSDCKGTRLWIRRIADQAPDASLTVVAEADDFPMLSAPRQFESFLREALGYRASTKLAICGQKGT
jgi:hypothetical protein